MLKEKWLKTYNLRNQTMHPCVLYPYSLLKMFYVDFIYVVFGIVIDLNMSTMLWNVSLLYINDNLYIFGTVADIY